MAPASMKPPMAVMIPSAMSFSFFIFDAKMRAAVLRSVQRRRPGSFRSRPVRPVQAINPS
jgi:hypothetical protein